MKIRVLTALLAAAAICGAAGAALAQSGATASQLTINGIPARNPAKLTVTSPAFQPGAAIPLANSAYGDNRMPGLSWTAGPAGTKSYVVILEDPDAGPQRPFLHWIAANIPATMTSLPAGMTTAPAGSGIIQTGVRNQPQYFGPRPPAGGPHNYTFQVFALDTSVTGADGLALADLKTQMQGHVLASGYLAGTYTGPAAPPAAAPAPKAN